MNDEHRDALIAAARAARTNAYAPFSHYRVGSAVLTADGEIFAGCNVENASYGLSICAERNAVFQAVASKGPNVQLAGVAVVTGDGGFPCGACLQVLREFAAEMKVYLIGDDGVREYAFSQLLPHPFTL